MIMKQQSFAAQKLAHPWLIVLVGFMGCGKTTVGKSLARRWKIEFIDLDKEICQVADQSIATIFATQGEAGFRQWEQQTLSQVLARYPLARNPLINKILTPQTIPNPLSPVNVSSPITVISSPAPQAVLALGGGTWGNSANRQMLQPRAISIWLNCELNTILTRLRPTDSRPLFQNPHQMAALLAARLPSYQLADYHLDVTTLSPAVVANTIWKYPLF
jgi:shikimate kinase